jgi:hypothetical protein
VKACALILLLAGCGAAPPPSRFVRPIDEDLIALVPAGADLLVDVDVEQLRGWTPFERIRHALPDEPWLHGRGVTSLVDVDQVVFAGARLGLPTAASLVLVRGDLDVEGAWADAALADYRGVRVRERGDDAAARIAPRLYAFGPPADVRRAIDLARGDGESVRVARGDGALMAAFARCPTAKSGRPALMAATALTDPLRERLQKEGLPGIGLEWLALSFAVGDGFDVGAIVGARGEAEARALHQAATDGLARLRRSNTVRALGLRPFLEAVQLVGRDNEEHLAYRLPGARVELMVSRLEKLYAKHE